MTSQPPYGGPSGPSGPPLGPGGPVGQEGGAEAPPTCYRHPDRETWVRCTRCDRPICPEDMREAPVGFQCPDCVAAGNAAVRQPRTALGGRVSADAGRLTLAIIALDVVVYFAQQGGSGLTRQFALFGYGVADGEYYRLLTAAFLHGSLFHLLANMYALYLFGPELEAALGRVRYLALFLVSALGGTAVSYLLGDPGRLALGASGAVFGLMGALLVVARQRRLETRPLLVLLGINLALPLLLPNIDFWAHLGGLATGALLAAAWAATARSPRRDLLHGAAAVLMLAAIAGVVLLRSAALLV